MASADLKGFLVDKMAELELWTRSHFSTETHKYVHEDSRALKHIETQVSRITEKPNLGKDNIDYLGSVTNVTPLKKKDKIRVERMLTAYKANVRLEYNKYLKKHPGGGRFISKKWGFSMTLYSRQHDKRPVNIYNALNEIVKPAEEELERQLKDYFKETIVLESSHDQDLVTKVVNLVKKEISDMSKSPGGLPASEQAIMNSLTKQLNEITGKIGKDLNDKIIFIELGGQWFNRASGAAKRQLTKKLQAIIANSWEELKKIKGSDSIVDAVKKDHINAIIEPFIITLKKNRNGKVNPRKKLNYKGVKNAVTTKAVLSSKQKKSNAQYRSAKTGRFISRRQASAQERGFNKAMSPLALIKTLNAQLPAAVAQNMGSPRLNFRTGRFANSVRVTDIGQTKVGQSIGYTYQTNPYQVFEMGKGRDPWSTPDRDPRPLIDMSIRQIMTQYTTKRFTTRRVM